MISEYVKLSDGIFLIENFYDKYLNLKDIILKNDWDKNISKSLLGEKFLMEL